MRILFALLLLTMTTACEQKTKWQGSLDSLLASQPERFSKVLQDPEKYRVQIMYTQIDRDSSNQPRFKTFLYNVNPGEYFYPASTVKLPVSALALEKLRRINRPGLNLDSSMLTM